MGVREFKIVLDKPSKTYNPGETIRGKVILVLDSPETIRGIRIKIVGMAHTYSRHAYCDNDEEYFSKTYSVADDLDVIAGIHEYPFVYTLPLNLPSSFESKKKLGYVRYIVKGFIDRKGWKFNLRTEVAFKVESTYDLNTDPKASKSIFLKQTKSFGLFNPSPLLTVNLSLPVRGFTPGQYIPIKVNINNQSGIPVTATKLTLAKYITYRAAKFLSLIELKENERVKIAEIHSQLEDNTIVNYEQVLKIPPFTPFSSNCRIIDIEYVLEVKVYVSKLSFSVLRMATPVLIGTIPLENYQSLVAPARINVPSAPMEKPSDTLATIISPLAPEYAELSRNIQLELIDSQHLI